MPRDRPAFPPSAPSAIQRRQLTASNHARASNGTAAAPGGVASLLARKRAAASNVNDQESSYYSSTLDNFDNNEDDPFYEVDGDQDVDSDREDPYDEGAEYGADGSHAQDYGSNRNVLSTTATVLGTPQNANGVDGPASANGIDGTDHVPATVLRGTWLGGRLPPLPNPPGRSYDLRLREEDGEQGESDASDASSNGDTASTGSAIGDDAGTDTDNDDDERHTWQDMLANVLQGDVLKGEKSRLAVTLAHQLDDTEGQRKYIASQLWVALRAHQAGRTVESEHRFLNEARAQVEAIRREIAEFAVIAQSYYSNGATTSDAASEKGSMSDANTTRDARQQVRSLLARVSWIESLYPSHQSMISAQKNSLSDANVEARVEALQSWQTITTRLHVQLGILQKWTGSESLEVTKPGTEAIPNGTNEDHSGSQTPESNAKNPRIIDTSSFIERMLKEDSLIKLFAKRTLTDITPMIHAAKDTMISNRELFLQCNLPPFSDDLTQLVSFPLRLMQEALSLRLDSAQRVNKDDPSIMLIDQLTDDFRDGLELATTMKKDYLALIEPDPEHGWVIPPMDLARYNDVLQDALRFFFKLLHWKLKSGSKSTLMKETEIVESEWDFLSRGIGQIDGGDLLVAEHFSMLTHRLIIRVTSYVNDQLDALKRRNVATTDTFRWFNQTLDNVRQRHRKLLRFGKALVQRLENSAEFSLESPEQKVDLGTFINALADSEHFLVYNGSTEQKGVYMIASSTLADKPDIVRRILTRCYIPSTQPDYAPEEGEDFESEFESPRYVLIISPRDPFIWTGRVMNLALPAADLDMRDRRVRVVAEGPDGRLAFARKLFVTLFPIFRHLVVADKMAHLARVNRDIKKIKLANFRLCESVVLSAGRVQEITKGRAGSEALLANYFTFAADLGQRSLRGFESKFRLRLMTELQKFSIRWVNFICEDCVPSDSRTFKWAVNALEFVHNVTRGDHILKLTPESFNYLRSGVASCMTLLISHFDILGARSTSEAKKEKDKQDVESQNMRNAIQHYLTQLKNLDRDLGIHDASGFQASTDDNSLRPLAEASTLAQERLMQALADVDEARDTHLTSLGLAGKAMESNRAEDQSLLNLAASSANINIRWQQGKFIGSGTFGTVYLAVNLDSGSLMAVKEIRFQDSASAPTLINQIREEMQVMSMLHHPNIVEYFGIEVHRDKVYIFEEYCQSGSLASHLEHGGRMADETVLQLYAYQLVDGLIYLHSQGVVHRDIKPDNILMDANGMMKLADFGSAKVLAKKSKTLAARTRAVSNPFANGPGDLANGLQNSLNGTPMYMAPEVIKGEHQNYQAAGDVWSLGCVVLECATGRRPWAGLDNEWAIMFHIGVAKEHPPLPDPSMLCQEGIEFIRLCLTIDASERPTSAELMGTEWMSSFQDLYADEMDSIATTDLLPSSQEDLMEHLKGGGPPLNLLPSRPQSAAGTHLNNIGEDAEEELEE